MGQPSNYIWIVEARSQSITIHQQGTKQATHLTNKDTLDGGEVIAGFSLALGDLFSTN